MITLTPSANLIAADRRSADTTAFARRLELVSNPLSEQAEVKKRGLVLYRLPKQKGKDGRRGGVMSALQETARTSDA